MFTVLQLCLLDVSKDKMLYSFSWLQTYFQSLVCLHIMIKKIFKNKMQTVYLAFLRTVKVAFSPQRRSS